MGKGGTISFTEIFNPDYRKYMGEGFLTIGLMMSGIWIGFAFFIIPGIVISIAWCLALLLVFDKKMDPISAIKKSNDATYGSKWMIFLGYLIYWVLIIAVLYVLALIPTIGWILCLIFYIVSIVLLMGVHAYIYKKLA